MAVHFATTEDPDDPVEWPSRKPYDIYAGQARGRWDVKRAFLEKAGDGKPWLVSVVGTRIVAEAIAELGMDRTGDRGATTPSRIGRVTVELRGPSHLVVTGHSRHDGRGDHWIMKREAGAPRNRLVWFVLCRSAGRTAFSTWSTMSSGTSTDFIGMTSIANTMTEHMAVGSYALPSSGIPSGG